MIPNSESADTATHPSNPDADGGFGVYVHWPFCAAKCPYCDFNSHVRHGGVDEASFRDAMVLEIEATAKLIGLRATGSVFFGGGTPSLMSAGTVAAVLDAIGRHWPLADDAEITLEANPTSVEAGKLRDFKAAGVNRVSLGVQSLRDDDLKALGRLHSSRDAVAAVKLAQSLFERVSFDLIYARSGQTLDGWERELKEAIGFAAGHLSLYQLTIEDGTPFAALHRAGKIAVPEAELADEFYALTQQITGDAGLDQYETSNHAVAGQECRHNLLYWRYGEYAGIGPGAHGRLIRPDGARFATATEPMPERWRGLVGSARRGVTEEVALCDDEIADEALVMGLRLREGVSVARIETLSGRTIDLGTVASLIDAGVLELDAIARRIRATDAGRFVVDRIVLELAATMRPLSPLASA